MQDMLKKVNKFFSQKKDKKNVPRTKEEREKTEKALRYVEERFGRALTRLSER